MAAMHLLERGPCLAQVPEKALRCMLALVNGVRSESTQFVRIFHVLFKQKRRSGARCFRPSTGGQAVCSQISF
jgi:hypothetical protein